MHWKRRVSRETGADRSDFEACSCESVLKCGKILLRVDSDQDICSGIDPTPESILNWKKKKTSMIRYLGEHSTSLDSFHLGNHQALCSRHQRSAHPL